MSADLWINVLVKGNMMDIEIQYSLQWLINRYNELISDREGYAEEIEELCKVTWYVFGMASAASEEDTIEAIDKLSHEDQATLLEMVQDLLNEELSIIILQALGLLDRSYNA